MSEVSDQCQDDSCLNQSDHMSIRVFPCLYHCKKMLCIKHLSEHDKYIEKQMQLKNQLEYVWKNYVLLFNKENIQKEYEKLKLKLENYEKLNNNITDLLLNNNFNYSIENNQKFQIAIETVKNAIQQENQLISINNHIYPKIEIEINNQEDNQPIIDYASLSSSITTNDDSLPSILNINENSPLLEQENDYEQDIDESDNHGNSIESDTMNNSSLKDENSVTLNRNLIASKIRGYCPLVQDGVFGINCHFHGINLCSKKSSENQRTYRLHEHFRRVHNLTPLASLALARAIGSGQNPMTTKLFNKYHIILNIDELRTITCPINKPFDNYPLLNIENFPCYTIKQVRHMKDHLKRVHKFSNKAANIILKSIKTDTSINMIQFPQSINIIEDDKHF